LIKEKYSEIIEGLILNYGDSVEKNAVRLLKTILECGVHEEDRDTIEYVCIKLMEVLDENYSYKDMVEEELSEMDSKQNGRPNDTTYIGNDISDYFDTKYDEDDIIPLKKSR